MQLASSPRLRLALAFLAVNALGWVALVTQRSCSSLDGDLAPELLCTSTDDGVELGGRQPWVWYFSDPMATEAQLGVAIKDPPATVSPAIAGAFHWDSEDELHFVPVQDWPPSTTVTASFGSNLRTVDGQRVRLSGDLFEATTSRLRLMRVSDAGPTDDNTARRVWLTFNQPPDPATLAKSLSIRTPVGETLAATVVPHENGPEALLLNVSLDPQRVDRLLLRLDASILRPASGSLPPVEDQTSELQLEPNLAVTHVETDTPGFGDARLHITFSRAVDPGTLRSFLSVSPDVRFTVSQSYSWWENRITLAGPFVPGVPYTVTAATGLPARTSGGGLSMRLPADAVRRVVFPDRDPSVAFPDEGRHLAASHPLRLSLRSVNTAEVEVRVDRIRTQNVVAFTREDRDRSQGYWGSESGAARNLMGRVATRRLRASGAANTPVDSVLDLREWLPADARAGAYLVTARTILRTGSEGDQSVATAERVVVVSDLGLSARVAQDRVLVWATSLGTAVPLDGVRVSLLSESNDRLADGVTSSDGTLELRFPEADQEDCPLVLLATRDDDTTFLPLDRSYESTAPANPPRDARPYPSTPYDAFVYTERGIYRPGETAYVKAVVRDERNQPPGTFPVRFRLIRPDGRTATEVTVPLSDLGTAETRFVFAPEWPTGGYAVRLSLPADDASLGSVSVALEEIVPPQIAVELAVPEGRWPLTRPMRFEVTSRHLFGAPAVGLPCQAQVRLEAAEFAPAEWPGYLFGDAAKQFPDETTTLESRILSEEGTASFSVPDRSGRKPPAALRATFLASVQQSGGRTVVATETRPVDAYPFYIGLKPSRDPRALRAKTRETVDIAVVAPDGTPAQNAPAALKITLERISRSSILRRQNDGSYRYVTETLTESVQSVDTAVAAGRVTLPLELPGAGEFRMTVADAATGASSSFDMDVSELDDQWTHAGTENPDRVLLEADKASYAPGDVALLTVKAPFAGLALVTVEGRHTLRRELHTLTNTAAVLSIPMDDAAFVPSVLVSITVLRATEPEARWSAHRANGTALLRVVPASHALAVALEAPAEIRPASALAVTAVVTDAAGAPAANVEVTVAAVDEGLCLLTSFRTPDPLAWCNAPRLAGILQYDLFGRLLPVLGAERPVRVSQAAGDSGVPIAPRLNPIRAPRFRTVALWSGTLRTDAEGRVTARFDVPEFTGQLRLMAVAVGASQYGSATGATRVKRPIIIQSSLPRFAAPGDRFTGTVELFNETDVVQAATLGVEAAGSLALEGKVTLAPLAARERRLVKLALRATEKPGIGRVTLSLSAPTAEVDYRETFELPVRPAAALTTTALAGRLAPGESLPIEPDVALLEGTLRARITCSPRPETGLGEALEELLRYPYGCLEQTVSSSFPLLYFEDLARSLRPDLFVDGQSRDFVAAGIGRVLGMQRSDGAFALWPRYGESYPWGSLYATHFLAEAKNAGHAVADYPLKAALDALRDALRRTPAVSGGAGAWQDDLRQRAYACHVLALAGRAEDARSWTDRLYEVAKDLPHDGRAHLAAALRYGGRPRESAAVLRLVAPPEQPYREYGGSLASDVRDVALLLAAWCELDPEAPEVPALAARLDRARTRGTWHTTQDNAVALMALGKFYRAMPADHRGYRGTLTVGDAVPLAFTHAAPFRWQSPDAATAAGLQLRNDGPGTLFYSVRLEGVPLKPADGAVMQGVGVQREWLHIGDGTPLKPRADGTYELAQGELVAVRLTLDVPSELDQVVVADLLPAGLELENPALHTSAVRPSWMPNPQVGWLMHQEMRDDRLLLFTRAVQGKSVFHYTARAVTPGDYVLPAVHAEAMYEPDLFGRSASGRVVVQ